jgi:hypothetical protein
LCSARVWAELHEKAVRRLGEATRLVVLDNLREGVLTPDRYDPALNPLYRDVLQYYGVTATSMQGTGGVSEICPKEWENLQYEEDSFSDGTVWKIGA